MPQNVQACDTDPDTKHAEEYQHGLEYRCGTPHECQTYGHAGGQGSCPVKLRIHPVQPHELKGWFRIFSSTGNQCKNKKLPRKSNAQRPDERRSGIVPTLPLAEFRPQPQTAAQQQEERPKRSPLYSSSLSNLSK